MSNALAPSVRDVHARDRNAPARAPQTTRVVESKSNSNADGLTKSRTLNPLGIIIVSQDKEFSEVASEVVFELDRESSEIHIDRSASPPFAPRDSSAHPIAVELSQHQEYIQTKTAALKFLARANANLDVVPVFAVSLDDALEQIRILDGREGRAPLTVGMLLLDATTSELPPALTDSAERSLEYRETDLVSRRIDEFYASLRELGIASMRTSFSIMVYTAELPLDELNVYKPSLRYNYRAKPEDARSARSDILVTVLDFLDNSYLNRRAHRRSSSENVALANELAGFLDDQSERGGANKGWDCYYYTGSVVSPIIDSFERIRAKTKRICLSGPNEHSLACGAFANWMLYQKPFLMVVTSGMADEFKGTLANLREARARGFIIVAESREGQWFPFQGTRTVDEDMMEVMQARRLPTFLLHDPEDLGDTLQNALAAYESNQGPVVLFATAQVLSHLGARKSDTRRREHSQTFAVGSQNQLRPIIDLINHERTRLVWHCGHLDDEEFEMVTAIAAEAGIALVDGLARPGTVSKYRDGKLQPNYLGTSSLYGFSERLHRYLHGEDGKLRPREELAYFFLKSKLTQISRPLSDGPFQNRLRVGQVTNEHTHMAPAIQYPCLLDLRSFLRRVQNELKVDKEVLEYRNAALHETPFRSDDRISQIRTTPMHANYFFARLNDVVEDLIVKDDYRYTGVYDVGRNAISAFRNVVRTGPGFSGWYGRALMGDALQSVIGLSQNCPDPIIAFIGDGAKGIVPDIRAALIDNLLHKGEFKSTITVFYFVNGVTGLISSYQERVLLNRARRQMRCPTILEPELDAQIDSIRLVQKTIHSFDAHEIREAIREPGRINFYNVIINHGCAVGDGLSRMNTTGWQELVEPSHAPLEALR